MQSCHEYTCIQLSDLNVLTSKDDNSILIIEQYELCLDTICQWTTDIHKGGLYHLHIKKNGYVTFKSKSMATPCEEQPQDYHDLFEMMDKDGNGFVTAEEIQYMFTTTLGRSTSKSEMERILKRMDMNKDGKIEYEEFVDYMNQEKVICQDNVSEEEKLARMFKIFDKDGSGSIDHTELQAILSMTGESIDDEEVALIMEEVDKDKNGSIDFEEFKQMMELLS